MAEKKRILKRHQKRALRALIECTEALGAPPSIAELAAFMEITKSGAQKQLHALREMGAITGPYTVGDWQPTALGRKLADAPCGT